jgi:streptogramin lyase
MANHRRTALALVATAALVIPATPAGAATVSDPIVEGLTSPLGLAIGDDGTIYVAQSFAGTLTSIDRKGHRRDIAQVDPESQFIAGVAAAGRGTVTYAVSGEPPQEVFRVLPNGKKKRLGNTSDVELHGNPDGEVMYGFQGLDEECAALFPLDDPATFPGDINPNAYAVAIMPDGSRVVADAGGNTLVRLAPNSRRATLLSLLPPVAITATSQIVESAGLPECVTGHDYWFHPVPTDVELGPDGMLYVSSLAGGPEDAGFQTLVGGTGGVFRVNPATGAATRIANGFLGAVDLAVAPNGDIYVAELYADRISKVVGGAPQPVADIPMPGAVEWANGMLYATGGVFASGYVVTIDVG